LTGRDSKISATRQLLTGLGLPESPRWQGDRLWFADHFRREVISADLTSGRSSVIERFDEEPVGLGFLADGTPLVALRNSRRILRLEADGPKLHADLSAIPGFSLADMIVDRSGRAYVSFRVAPPVYSQDNQGVIAGADKIVLVHRDGSFETVAEGMTTPNGLALDEQATTLIIAETRAQRLIGFSVSDSGALADRRVFAQLPSNPDGIAVDREGAVWAGSPNAGEFLRVIPGGQISERIPVKPRLAIACALVGRDRRTLALMTVQATFEELAKHQSIGFVELAAVEIDGGGTP
jgi:sugar lactone lactonase YvrE